MSSVNKIRPTGVMEGINPLSLRSIESQRARLERQQAKAAAPPRERAYRWPRPPAISAALAQIIRRYEPQNPAPPPPIAAYAGRFEAAVMWREDVETFAVHLTHTAPDGERQARWIGTHPAHYPTIESLAQTLDAHGIGLDRASLTLAQDYQRDVWAAAGACTITGIQTPDGHHHLAAVTPNGQILSLAPHPERDDRSQAFGPNANPCRWGYGDPAGALETARIVLDYTESTLRTETQLFDDARSLAVTSVTRWPPDVAVSVADLHRWTHTHQRIPARATSPAIDHLRSHTERAIAKKPARENPRQSAAKGAATRSPVGRPPISRTLEA